MMKREIQKKVTRSIEEKEKKHMIRCDIACSVGKMN